MSDQAPIPWDKIKATAERNAVTLRHAVVLEREGGGMTLTLTIEQNSGAQSVFAALVKKLQAGLMSRRPILVNIGGRSITGDFIVRSMATTGEDEAGA